MSNTSNLASETNLDLTDAGSAVPYIPTSSRVLRTAEQKTLAMPAPHYGFLARTLFKTLDFVYGRAGSLPKFVVLELVARVPYQAWENVGYVAISHQAENPHFGRRIFDYVREARAQQDNEQWHLFILQELAQQRGHRPSWLRYSVFPQLLALVYYHVAWLLYVVNPRLSYSLNADFEMHAERCYMQYVHDHPALEYEVWDSVYSRDYGNYTTVADVLRRIALDERAHRIECLARMRAARFSLATTASSSSG